MVDVRICFTDGIVGLGGASVEPWKRQVARSPKVPGRKGLTEWGVLHSEEAEHLLQVQALCIAKGRD